MTTLNAMANNAYHALVAETERENPGDVWAGFENERDAFEAGYEAALQAQPAASRERMIEVLGGSELAAATVDHLLAAGVFSEPQPECGAVDRSGQRRCVFTPGHHEVENWTSHGDRGGWTWNDQPASAVPSDR